MLKQPIVLEEITFQEYSKRAESEGLLARNERESPRYAYAEIAAAPTYSSFYELLQDLQKAVRAGYVRLIHVPGKGYSESEDEFEERFQDPDYYRELAERAEQAQALNVELNLISNLPEKAVRGSKLIFRKNGDNGMVYLAKAYLHREDFGEMGVKCDVERKFHGVSAIYLESGKSRILAPLRFIYKLASSMFR